MKRKKLWKKVIGTGLAAAMTLSMAGCGGTDSGKERGKSEDKAQAGASSEKEESKSGDEKITLKFWDMVWGDADYATEAEKLAKSYTEVNPNVEIEYQSIPWQNRYETFSVAIASGDGPDVSTGGGYQQHQFGATGDILPLNSIVEEWEKEGTADDFSEGMLEFFQDEEGNQLGIPFNVEPRGIIYRKDLFEEKGIEIPTTWDELYDAAVALTDVENDQYGMVYPVADSAANVTFVTWMIDNGGGVWSEDGKTPTWNSDENLETLEYLAKLRDAGVFPEGMASYENADASKLFLQGKAAMFVGSAGFGSQIKEAGDDFAANCALMPMPKGPSAEEPAMAAALNAYMVYSSTEYPEEAKAFVKWWSEENMELWTGAAKCNSSPARLSFINDKGYTQMEQNPLLAELGELWIPEMKSTMYPAAKANLVQNTIDAEKWWRDASQALLVGEKTPQQILDEKQKATEDLIKDIGY